MSPQWSKVCPMSQSGTGGSEKSENVAVIGSNVVSRTSS